MEIFGRLLRQARFVLASMPPSQRYSVAILLGVVAVSLVMLVTWGSQETYVPCLSELTGSQMTDVQKALEGSGIAYRFRDRTLFVGSADRDKVLMVLTQKGALPSDVSSSFGFEDIVKPKGFSLETAEEQRMKFNIALGNMLARAIATAPEIASAQVHIASSRDGYFGPKKATAAVNIRPRGQGRIPESKLAGICRLVAASVGPELAPESVVVTNLVSGAAFSLEDGNSSFAKAASRMELQQGWDAYYDEAVRKFLSPSLGRVWTLVTVKVDTRTTETTETEYAVKDETTREFTETNAQPAGGGTLTTPNVGVSVQTGGQGTGGSSETIEKEKKRAPSKMVRTDVPPGEIEDIQISVMADLKAVKDNIRTKDGLGAEDAVTQARLDQECKYWENRLRTGLPVLGAEAAARISKVTFSAEPFGELQVFAAGIAAPSAGSSILDELLANWQRIGLAALAIVALLMVKSVAKHAPESEAAMASADQVEEEEEIELPEVMLDIEQKRAMKVRESVEDMMQHDPQTAVNLIRRWVARET